MNRRYLKHKINSIVLLMLVMLFTLAPATAVMAAEDQFWDENTVPSTRLKPLVYDTADLLTSEEENLLTSYLEEISSQHRCNVVVLTTDTYINDIEAFSDDYFDYNGFGADYDDSGVLFLINMNDRAWDISTSGSAIYAFTDYAQDQMMDKIIPYLKDGNYYGAFKLYGETADKYLEMYEDGTAYDVGVSAPKTGKDLLMGLFACIGIGLIGALVPIAIMRAQLNNVHMNASAAGYQSRSGIKMSLKTDNFRHQTISKRPIPQESSSRSGGGSSIHTSSSGHSHGGSHGHF